VVKNLTESEKTAQTTAADGKKTGATAPFTVTAPAVPAAAKGGIPAQQRVDYLAGFVGISAILVTMSYFGLTFWELKEL
jgi:hypothetical protein